VQNQEERAVCNCSMLGPATDDMEHILTKCDSPGQNEVWNLARRLWEMKGGTWPHVSIGLIMGAGQVNFAAQTEEGPRPDSYMSRLFRIIIRTDISERDPQSVDRRNQCENNPGLQDD
jgi:hypothetical protein